MAVFSPQVSKILTLLAQGKQPEAKTLASTVENRLTKRKAELAKEQDQIEQELAAIEALKRGFASTTNGATAAYSDPVVDKDEARLQILVLAEKLAEESQKAISVAYVEARAREAGIPLSGNPKTQIGNILYRSGSWNRVSKGVFRIKKNAAGAQPETVS